jgi:hypothetical protein
MHTAMVVYGDLNVVVDQFPLEGHWPWILLDVGLLFVHNNNNKVVVAVVDWQWIFLRETNFGKDAP